MDSSGWPTSSSALNCVSCIHGGVGELDGVRIVDHDHGVGCDLGHGAPARLAGAQLLFAFGQHGRAPLDLLIQRDVQFLQLAVESILVGDQLLLARQAATLPALCPHQHQGEAPDLARRSPDGLQQAAGTRRRHRLSAPAANCPSGRASRPANRIDTANTMSSATAMSRTTDWNWRSNRGNKRGHRLRNVNRPAIRFQSRPRSQLSRGAATGAPAAAAGRVLVVGRTCRACIPRRPRTAARRVLPPRDCGGRPGRCRGRGASLPSRAPARPAAGSASPR